MLAAVVVESVIGRVIVTEGVIYNDLTISSFKKVCGEQRHYRVLFSLRINL
jgi:hypothetical protein